MKGLATASKIESNKQLSPTSADEDRLSGSLENNCVVQAMGAITVRVGIAMLKIIATSPIMSRNSRMISKIANQV